MIVKNEEQVLERCLSSIADLMDEIIIVDTGSIDKTKEIARRFTDGIYDFTWADDFSAARNFSFQKATKEYIYVADADEVVDEENRERFRILKETLIPEIEIVQMKYCNQLQYGTTYNFDTEYRGKLYKRLREFKWVDPIHETVQLSPVVYDSDVEIIHLSLHSHGNRDFQLLQRVIKQGYPLSKKLHNMYAKELFIVGEDKDFLEAENFFVQTMAGEDKGVDELKEAACVLARIYRLKRETENFFKHCIKDMASQSCSEICYELGEYYYEKKDYQEALIWYYNAAYETNSILNIRYSGDIPRQRLADAYDQLGDKKQADFFKNETQTWIRLRQ